MDIKKIIEQLKNTKEMNPDAYDGSYELMREIIGAYSEVDDLSKCSFLDLNAIYSMAIGSWKQSSQIKKEYVNKGCLSDKSKKHICGVIDCVWDNACRDKYENRDTPKKPAFGMFGTGKNSFKGDVTDLESQAIIEMLCDIYPMVDEEKIFARVEKVLNKPINNFQAGKASVILHCLKPMVFPILNSNDGHGTIFEALGIKLNEPQKASSYIDNCRAIRNYRDKNFGFKNYRILDIAAWNVDKNTQIKEVEMKECPYDKNTILYGPPGTGKTYNSVKIAVSICEPDLDISSMEYKEILDIFNKLKEEKRIAFTTFHQSYSYEEFIEGIKPRLSDDSSSSLEYEVKSGIFKQFCEQATLSEKNAVEGYGLNSSPVIWKVSLGHTYDNPIRKDCMDNGHIRIGWDEYGEELPETDESYNGKAVLNAFYNKMRKGDLVLSCYTASTIDAIGVVEGECEWHDEYSDHKRLRKVKWLFRGEDINIVELNNGSTMTLSTVYQMRIPVESVLQIV